MPTLLVTSLVLATGCNFAVDGKLVKDDPQHEAGETPPCEGASCTPEQGDAGADEPCVGSECVDSGTDEQCDGPCGSCGSECPEQDPCTSDTMCAQDQYCSKVSGQCEARCSDELGCAGPIGDEFRQAVVEGDTMYWTELPKLGDASNKDAVYVWNFKDEPRVIDHFWKLITLIDGYFYLDREDRTGIDAVPAVAGEGEPFALPSATAVWSTEEYIWWSARAAAGGAALWRTPRGKPLAPELLGSAPHDGWLLGTKSVVMRAVDFGIYHFAPITNLSGPETELSTLNDGIEADDEAMYCVSVMGPSVGRFDPLKPTVFTELTPYNDQAGWTSASLNGDWVYWTQHGDDSSQLFGRTPKKRQLDPQVIPLPESAEILTVFKNSLVYKHQEEKRLFVLPLPPLPCSDTVGCTEGLSCVEDVCR
jgi:hypothetical protein